MFQSIKLSGRLVLGALIYIINYITQNKIYRMDMIEMD